MYKRYLRKRNFRENTEFNVKIKGGYFVIEKDGAFAAEANKWSTKKYTEEQAIKASKTLINCKRCIDCEDCEDCLACKSCINCVDCDLCENCISCEDCVECYNCKNCVHIDEEENLKNVKGPLYL